MLVIGINDTHDASACLIKDGQIIDVVLEANLKPYDYIASVAIISGAGGRFTDWKGNNLNLKSDGKILASGDPTIHKKLLKVIQKVK